MSRTRVGGGLGFVLVGIMLGAGLTLAALWAAGGRPEQLPSSPTDSGRPRTLDERMQPVQAACQREYGYDRDMVVLCTSELKMQILQETIDGTAPEDVERLERARRAAGMR